MLSLFVESDSRPLLLMCFGGSFICTYLAPHRQPVFVDVCFVKVALGLPALAPSTSLLFHSINNPMSFFISETFFHSLSVFLVISAFILTLAVFAPITKSVSRSGMFCELTFCFPPFAFGTVFLLDATNCAMTFFITVVSSRGLLVSAVILAVVLTPALFAPRM